MDSSNQKKQMLGTSKEGVVWFGFCKACARQESCMQFEEMKAERITFSGSSWNILSRRWGLLKKYYHRRWNWFHHDSEKRKVVNEILPIGIKVTKIRNSILLCGKVMLTDFCFFVQKTDSIQLLGFSVLATPYSPHLPLLISISTPKLKKLERLEFQLWRG